MTDERPDLPYCARCGDVTACLHRPDEIVRRAFENEARDVERSKEVR